MIVSDSNSNSDSDSDSGNGSDSDGDKHSSLYGIDYGRKSFITQAL